MINFRDTKLFVLRVRFISFNVIKRLYSELEDNIEEIEEQRKELEILIEGVLKDD